jgi:uncharacterized protein (TIGR02301 family)
MKCAPYLLLTFFLLAVPAGAQAPKQNRANNADELLQLSEILGALHYLRPLCGASEQGQWRVEMQALVDEAGLPADKRAWLIAGFNRAYAAHQRAHAVCTNAARVTAQRLMDQGTRLSREIALRHRN